jgi:hypothetical protein
MKRIKVVPLLYSNSPPLRQGGLRKSAFETTARWPHEIRLAGAATQNVTAIFFFRKTIEFSLNMYREFRIEEIY